MPFVKAAELRQLLKEKVEAEEGRARLERVLLAGRITTVRLPTGGLLVMGNGGQPLPHPMVRVSPVSAPWPYHWARIEGAL